MTCWHKATEALAEKAHGILTANHPMTLRQLFYQMVSGLVQENTDSQYKKLSRIVVQARQSGLIPWEWVDDRMREPREVSMWDGLADFGKSVVPAYRLNTWEGQPRYFEVWVEKDALSGIFSDVLRDYGVTLNVGRGYDGWTSIKDAADRFSERDAEDFSILYFGDFDPSGEDMAKSLRERLAFFGCTPDIVKCALTREDIDEYQLPPMPTKKSDTRRAAFVALHGDMAVELDALPVNVLRDRLRHEVEARLDLSKLAEVKDRQEVDRAKLAELMRAIR